MVLEQSQAEELQQLVNEWLKQKNIPAGAKVAISIVPNQVIIPGENKTESNPTGGFQRFNRTIVVDMEYQHNYRGYCTGVTLPHCQTSRQGPFEFSKPLTQEDDERLQRVGEPTATVIRRVLQINGITYVNLPLGSIVSVGKEESVVWTDIDQQVLAILKDVLFPQGEVFVEYAKRRRGKDKD